MPPKTTVFQCIFLYAVFGNVQLDADGLDEILDAFATAIQYMGNVTDRGICGQQRITRSQQVIVNLLNSA